MNPPRPGSSACDVTVIGAGVVGVCCALALQREGHRVVVIDPRQPGTATSFGNAGIIATGSIMPYSTPELWKEIPGILFGRMSPLVLRWRHLHRSIPWLLKFLAAGRSRRAVERTAAELASLSRGAERAHRDLMHLASADANLMRPAGYLEVYRDGARFDRESRWERSLVERHGTAAEVLHADELHQLEPGLASVFERGWFFPDKAFVVNPVALTRAYAEAFVALGGELRHEQVRGFEIGAEGPVRVVTDLGMHRVSHVVICAGAWSAKLARQLGSRVPLETERGYHLNVPWSDGLTLNRPVVVMDHHYVLAPMADGVRITSGAELGGLVAPPDFRHIRRAHAHARQVLPGLGSAVNREWMGYRPSLPDSKPVIARSPRCARVLFAFGHGHLGLTLSAVSAEAIAALVAEREFSVPLAPFRVDRF